MIAPEAEESQSVVVKETKAKRRSTLLSIRNTISEVQFFALQLNLGIHSLNAAGSFTKVELERLEAYCESTSTLQLIRDILLPVIISLTIVCTQLSLPLRPVT